MLARTALIKLGTSHKVAVSITHTADHSRPHNACISWPCKILPVSVCSTVCRLRNARLITESGARFQVLLVFCHGYGMGLTNHGCRMVSHTLT